MCSTNSATLSTPYQHQGRQLFDLLGLLDLGALHRQRRRADPMGQAGHRVRRRRRGARLDAVGAVRRHGRHVIGLQRPARGASRAYDKDRDGFVIAGGAGVVVLEELEHAKARGAQDLRRAGRLRRDFGRLRHGAPSGEGAVRCMRHGDARASTSAIDYINPHATSTPIGDLREIEAIREVFGDKCRRSAATKSLTGHSLGAAGVQEAIYSLLMMNNGFICESANIESSIRSLPTCRSCASAWTMSPLTA